MAALTISCKTDDTAAVPTVTSLTLDAMIEAAQITAMIDIRPFNSLGHANHGWLDARHHFSFANYHDPKRMGWGRIRVWNDDTIGAQSGFPPHPHRDMEIVTYVRTGAITHQDSMGNKGRTARRRRPGDERRDRRHPRRI